MLNLSHQITKKSLTSDRRDFYSMSEISMNQFKTLAEGTNYTSLILSDGELKVVRLGEVIAIITNW
ncbi:hypothetical protein CTY88_02700 [Acinetobacter seifertii]|nr:hypothetical protein [Acinetobacter seifertii]